MKKIKNLFSAINTKITVLFLLLFIPLFLAGFSIYKYGYTSVKQEITDSSTSQLSLYAHSLSDEITRIQLSCYQLAFNEDINYLANAYSIMGEYERSQYILSNRTTSFHIAKQQQFHRKCCHLHPCNEKNNLR